MLMYPLLTYKIIINFKPMIHINKTDIENSHQSIPKIKIILIINGLKIRMKIGRNLFRIKV